MGNEIDTILDVEVQRHKSGWLIGSTYLNSAEGTPDDRIMGSILELQQQLPDDRDQRRAAAIDFIGWAKDSNDIQAALIQLFARLLRKNRPHKDKRALETALSAAFNRWDLVDESAESEYYDPSPDYPEQWLEHMSEESAEWMIGFFEFFKKSPFSWCRWPEPRFEPPPTEICQNNGGLGVIVKRHDTKVGDVKSVRAMPIAFRGALELPEFIDEEEL
jgi:hypothetical protein